MVAHIDADGLCSAAVATRALTAAGIDHDVRFLKTLGIEEMGKLLDENPRCAWFVDLGSGMADNFPERPWVISDHHTATDNGPVHHLNPLRFGHSGSEVSGAGMTWAVGRHLFEDRDLEAELASLAIVGAVGDLQHAEKGRLYGMNRAIVEEA
ncbi:MAG: recombinase RecJ, partial [Candidatus Thermoplasmatota archaeon]|nr:recombinase RecJ [Candidatus Thermoplasmatota archaeon]